MDVKTSSNKEKVDATEQSTTADACNHDGSKNISANTSRTKDAGLVLAGSKRTTKEQMYEHSNKRVKMPSPSIQGATNHPVDTGDYKRLSDHTFFYDDDFWIKAFDVIEQSQTALKATAHTHEAESSAHTHEAESSAQIYNGSKAFRSFPTNIHSTSTYHQGVSAYEAQMQQKQRELILEEKNLSSKNEGRQRYSDDHDRYSSPGFRQMQLPYDRYNVADEHYSDPHEHYSDGDDRNIDSHENHSDAHEHYSVPVFQQMQPPRVQFPDVRPSRPFEELVYKAVIDNIPHAGAIKR